MDAVVDIAAREVDEHVDRAEPLDDRRDRALDRTVVGDVEREEQRPFAERRGHACAVVRIEIEDRDACTGAAQVLRDRGADQRGAAGDERDFASKGIHGVSPGIVG